jgi:hypothetical protein
MTKIDFQNGTYLLDAPGWGAAAFSTCGEAMEFAVKTLRRQYSLTTAATVAWNKEVA